MKEKIVDIILKCSRSLLSDKYITWLIHRTNPICQNQIWAIHIYSFFIFEYFRYIWMTQIKWHVKNKVITLYRRPLYFLLNLVWIIFLFFKKSLKSSNFAFYNDAMGNFSHATLICCMRILCSLIIEPRW